MTDTEKINIVKAMLGKEETDEIISVYLNIASNMILDRLYPFGTTSRKIPVEHECLQCEVATFLYNKRGAEGELIHDEVGISRRYENAGLPDSYAKRIVPHAKVIKYASTTSD